MRCSKFPIAGPYHLSGRWVVGTPETSGTSYSKVERISRSEVSGTDPHFTRCATLRLDVFPSLCVREGTPSLHVRDFAGPACDAFPFPDRARTTLVADTCLARGLASQ